MNKARYTTAELSGLVEAALARSAPPARPLRILWCSWKDTTHPLAGGAEEYTDQVRRHLVRRGHDVHLACAAVAGQAPTEVVDGVVVHRSGGPLHGVYRAARLLYERSWADWDVVVDEVNTRPFDAPGWTRGTPVVAHIHQVAKEVWSYETPRPIALLGRHVVEPAWLRAYRNTVTTTPSRSTVDSLVPYGVRRAVDVGIGGELTPRSHVPVRESSPTVVCVGRVCGMKRPAEVLEAHRLLLMVRPDAQLWFIGGGPDLDDLRERAAGIAGVEVLGRVTQEEKDSRLSRAWAHTCASVREGWGLVVSEAAAAGTFTVAYDRPGLRDSVIAAGGVLCEPNPAALAAALDAHLDDMRSSSPSSTGVLAWDAVARGIECALFAAIAEQHTS